MKVLDSRVRLSGGADERVQFLRRERLSAWNRRMRVDMASEQRIEGSATRIDAQRTDDQAPLSISDEARRLAADPNAKIVTAAVRPNAPGAQAEGDDWPDWMRVMDARMRVQILIIEQLTGRKVLDDPGAAVSKSRANAERRAGEATATTPQNQPANRGWGVALDIHEETTEVRSASFEAQGVVKTADGRKLAFDLKLAMSDTRVTVSDFSLRAGDPPMTDPLVINFDGHAAELTDAKFDFDLNADGRAESVSFVKTGSGFLVLDRNGDGVVNDGSEMFGPTTGDGFGELAAFDDDANGWIDEADTVYGRLGVWTRDESGDQVRGLKASNVGAIYLGEAATPFRLDDAAGNTQGQIQSTGVFLEESGGVGTVQHVDLVT